MPFISPTVVGTRNTVYVNDTQFEHLGSSTDWAPRIEAAVAYAKRHNIGNVIGFGDMPVGRTAEIRAPGNGVHIELDTIRPNDSWTLPTHWRYGAGKAVPLIKLVGVKLVEGEDEIPPREKLDPGTANTWGTSADPLALWRGQGGAAGQAGWRQRPDIAARQARSRHGQHLGHVDPHQAVARQRRHNQLCRQWH